MQITTLIPALILLVTQSKTAFGDVFTAMADMEGLIATEFELVKHLDTYIQEEEKRMKQLRGWKMKKNSICSPKGRKFLISFFSHYVRILEEYESMYQEAIADVPKYLANPVNAYLLVKRLTSDWKKVEGVISKNAGSGTWILSSSFISFNLT